MIPPKIPYPTAAYRRGYNDGYDAGTMANPYPPLSKEYQAYCDGQTDGLDMFVYELTGEY